MLLDMILSDVLRIKGTYELRLQRRCVSDVIENFQGMR